MNKRIEGSETVLPSKGQAGDAHPHESAHLHVSGEATYVDAEVGLLETIVGSGLGSCSLMLSLQGRASGTPEAFVTLEPLGQGPPPPLAPLVAELERRARNRLEEDG